MKLEQFEQVLEVAKTGTQPESFDQTAGRGTGMLPLRTNK